MENMDKLKEITVEVEREIKNREPFYIVSTYFRNLETDETWWSTYRTLNLCESDCRYLKILEKVKDLDVVFNKDSGDYDDEFLDFYDTAKKGIISKEEADFMYEGDNIPEDMTGYFSDDCDDLTCDEVEIMYVDMNSQVHNVKLKEGC